jgi:hypothetical protein
MRQHSRHPISLLFFILALVFSLIFVILPLGHEVRANPGLVWMPMPSFTVNDLNSVWGTSGTDVYAAGSNGTILYYDGSVWTPMTGNTTSDIYSIWGVSSTDIFAAGANGTIQHYDGSLWSSMSSNTTVDLYGIRGNSSTDVTAVGFNGTIQHYDGVSWSAVANNVNNDLYDVWISPVANLTAGAAGMIESYTLGAWGPVASGTANDLFSLWVNNSNDIFAAGAGGTVVHYNGAVWSGMTTGGDDFYGVWSSGAAVFAVGAAGRIAKGPGDVWLPMESYTNNDLSAIWGASGTDIFAVGTAGTILHCTDDSTPPSAAIVYFPPGPYRSGDSVNITATFSEPVADFPVIQLAISGNNTMAPADMTKIDVLDYIYSYTIGPGNGTANVTLSTGTDLAGNPIISVPVFGAQFTIDNSAPVTAEATTPANDSSYINANMPGVFSGQAADNAGGTGLAANSAVFTLARNADGAYWNGNAWAEPLVWLPTTHVAAAGGDMAVWTSSASLPSWTSGVYTIRTRVIDNAGNSFIGGPVLFQFTVLAGGGGGGLPPATTTPPPTTTTETTPEPEITEEPAPTPTVEPTPSPDPTETPTPTETTETTPPPTTAAPPPTTNAAGPPPTTTPVFPPPTTATYGSPPGILNTVSNSTTVGGTSLTAEQIETISKVRKVALAGSLFNGGTLPWYLTQVVDAKTLAGTLLSGGAFLPSILGRTMRRKKF